MDKRIQIIDGAIVASIVIQLSLNEAEAFENKTLCRKINTAAKDFKVDWAIEVNKDGSTSVCVSRTYETIIGNKELHDLEISAIDFVSAVEEMQIAIKEAEKKKKETKCVEGVDKDEIDFVKSVLDDIANDKVLAAFLMASVEEEFGGFGCVIASPGRIGQITLRKMCECYLEKYDHE